MSLTKEDLQAISELMDSRLDSKLAPINTRLDTIQAEVGSLKADMQEVKTDVKAIRHELDEYVWKDIGTFSERLTKHESQPFHAAARASRED